MTKGSTGSFPYKTTKKPLAQGYSSLASLSTAETRMWELDHKESWVPKNMLWTVVLEKTLESPLDCKEIKPVNPKGNQSWILIWKTDAEAPILWPPDVKNWLTGKDPNAGKDWRQEENGIMEDEMVGWNHQLNGHEFEQAPGVGDGQENLACCSLLVTQSWMTLCNLMACSPSGSSVHDISQARILEWVAISFSRGSFQPRDQTRVSCTAGRFFTDWATREAHAAAYVVTKSWTQLSDWADFFFFFF